MPHIRRRRGSYEPTLGRPIYYREVIVGGKVLFEDVCDPKDCSNRALVLDAYEHARWQRDPEWAMRRKRPGGVEFYRGGRLVK